MTPVASDTPAEPPEHHGDHDQEYQDALARRIQAILEPLGVRLGLACHVHRVSAVHVRYAAGGSGSSPSSAPHAEQMVTGRKSGHLRSTNPIAASTVGNDSHVRDSFADAMGARWC